MTKPFGGLCGAIKTECTILVAVPVAGTEGSSLPQEQDSCPASALGLPAHPVHVNVAEANKAALIFKFLLLRQVLASESF